MAHTINIQGVITGPNRNNPNTVLNNVRRMELDFVNNKLLVLVDAFPTAYPLPLGNQFKDFDLNTVETVTCTVSADHQFEFTFT